MADNVAITAGSGTSIATQDEGGVHYQEVKLVASGTGTTAALTKAEDAAHTSADHGLVALAVRRDTAAVGSDTDGDYSTLNVTSAGRLYTSATVDAALPAGTNAIGKLAANSGVDIGDVDVTSVASIIPGTGATNSGKAVDAVAGATDTGVAVLAVRDDTLATLTPADGDYTHLRVSSTGALHVTGSAGVTEKANGAAWTAADNGVQMLGVRRDTAAAGTGVIDGDYAGFNVDASGRLWTHNVDLTPAGDTMVDDTNDALRVTVVTGVQNAGVVASSGLAISKAGGQITSATTTTLKSSVGGQTIQIIALMLKNGALSNNIKIQDSTGPTNLVGTSAEFNLTSFEGLVLDPKATGWFNATGSGESLDLVTSSAGPLTWYLEYTQG